MDDYNRQATDARFGAIGQAGQEQQRMMDMAAQRAGFQNAAQQQAYDQVQGRGSFANQAQASRTRRTRRWRRSAMPAWRSSWRRQQSVFNAQNAARNQYMQEQYAQRNQPINEITSLMSGSQVQQPNWLNSPQFADPDHRHRRIDQPKLRAAAAELPDRQSELAVDDGRHPRARRSAR